MKNTGRIKNNKTAIYDEEENSTWRKERRRDCLFQHGIGVMLLLLVAVVVLYVIIRKEYIDGTIGMFLLILIMDTGVLSFDIRGWLSCAFLKVSGDEIILPRKQGLFLKKRGCPVEHIKKAYPNTNTMRNYIVLLTAKDDPVWHGEPIQIWKKDIYSVENFMDTLEKLGIEIERNRDCEVLYLRNGGTQRAPVAREVKE